MDSSALQEIIRHYENSLPMLPETTAVERKNKNHLRDAIKQVKRWSELATGRKEDHRRAESIEDFMQMLSAGLKSKVTPERIEKAMQILKRLKRDLPPDFDYASLFRHVNVQDEEVMRAVLADLETKPFAVLLDEVRGKEK
jgi:putative protein kinase ArgK-like GTPase of G3E family